MKILNSIKQVYNYTKINKSIGFVPTMGKLHQGHISLINRSRKENDLTIASIFVNPLQFNNKDDFLFYPKNHKTDIQLLKDNNLDALFIPSKKEATKLVSTNSFTVNINNNFENCYESINRPEHFNGVATIVLKLNNIVQPNNIYFGQKDALQCIVIKKLFNDFFLDLKTNVVICPTLREYDGLAYSTRNEKLSLEERSEVKIIYQSLQKIKSLKIDNLNIYDISKIITDDINQNSKILELEYISFNNYDNFDQIFDFTNKNNIIISLVVKTKYSKIRLLDNIIIKLK
jgi:pantoate--beta-alanine ligase